MNRARSLPIILAIASLTTAVLAASADDLRNVKHGQPVPVCKLPALDGSIIDTESLKGSVVVIVCLSAEQHRSELAAAESMRVVQALPDQPVKLIHLTADVVQKAYFEKLRRDNAITAALALDADRAFYARVGIIAFPTTIIIDKDGKLENVISLHSSEYQNLLDAHVGHALGNLSDEQLAQRLAARPSSESSPRSAAAAHRAMARLMREKGDLASAKAELEKGRKLDPDNRELLLDLADLDLFAGNLDASDEMLQLVLASQPDHKRAKQLKGIILFRRGQLDEAQTVLEDALKLNPSPELAHYYLGRIFEQRGQLPQALEQYRAALKRFVHDPDAASPAAK